MKCRQVFIALAITLLATVPLAAQEKPAADPFEGFPEFVEKVMADWDVPGLAVAVVKDGEVIYSRGFGFRDVENKLEVTHKTLFAIGSCSKAFTVISLGMLVDEGKLNWDEPLIDYLQDWRLQDEYATLHFTPRDLLCHDSGLPRHDLSWYGADATREELYKRIRYLEPNAEFRSLWQYNNFMFLTGGVLLERLSGKTWEEFVGGRVFAPLGMTGSNFSVEDSKKTDDYSLPYEEKDDKTVAVPFRNLDAMGPAGSINSNVEDMAKWVLLHLNKGKVGETQLVNESTLLQMHTPIMVIRQNPTFPELPLTAYGMGWFIQPYRGHHMIQHGGGIDGFISLTSFMPFDNIGCVVLTNKAPNPLASYITYNVYDRLLGMDQVDWSSRGLEQQKQAEEAGEAENGKRVEGTSPSLPLEHYAGTYENPGYSRVVVELADGVLTLAYNGEVLPLEHYHFDVFTMDHPESENFKIWFRLNVDGEIDRLTAPMQAGVEDIVFTRVADESLATEEHLAKFVGTYELQGVQFSTDLRGDNVLTLTVPGQPTYELVPYSETEFKIKDIDGYSVEFKLDESGAVTEVVLHQPNGSFTAKKIK